MTLLCWAKFENRARALALASFVSVIVTACGGGDQVRSIRQEEQAIVGHVIKGPRTHTIVTAHALDDNLQPTEALGSASPDEAGKFKLILKAYSGPLALVASAGIFAGEVDSRTATERSGLVFVIPRYEPWKAPPVVISPISHLAAGLTFFYVRNEGRPLSDASDEAWQNINAHFGNLDWRSTVPRNIEIDSAGDAEEMNRAGFLMAAFSEEVRSVNATTGLTPGLLNESALAAALYDDLVADGYFDGVGKNGEITLPSDRAVGEGSQLYRLNGQTVRITLAVALVRFLISERNKSGLQLSDVLALRNALSTASNPRIFRDTGSDFDSTPPVVSILAPTNQFVRDEAIVLTIDANDGSGSGVRQVWLQEGENPPMLAQNEGGLWMAMLRLSPGAHHFSVWATDNVEPANSGRGRSKPFTAQLTILRDIAPPVLVTFDGSYRSEGFMNLERDGNGVPSVPPQFTFDQPTMNNVLVRTGATIRKSSGTLSWGPNPPTAEDFEGGNPKNVPFLRFGAQFIPDVDSPIEGLTYSINNCLAGSPTTGRLIRSPKDTNGLVNFYLPLSIETLPWLESAKPAYSFCINVSGKDVAGNVSVLPNQITIYYLVTGPIVSVTRDTAWETLRDPRSVFAYLIRDGSYHKLSSSNPELISDANSVHYSVRGIRYVVRNPYPFPVPFTITAPGSVTLDEGAAFEVYPMTSSVSEDGFSFPRRVTWIEDGRVTWWPEFSRNGTEPCDRKALTEGTLYPAHRTGFALHFSCYATPYVSSGSSVRTRVLSASTVTPTVYEKPRSSGGELSPAERVANGDGTHFYVIPPAKDGKPGELAIYLERPFANRERNLIWQLAGADTLAYREPKFLFYQIDGPTDVCGSWLCREMALYRMSSVFREAIESWNVTPQIYTGVLNMGCGEAGGRCTHSPRSNSPPAVSLMFQH